MWSGRWKHVCTDGTEARQDVETERHPVNGTGKPANCEQCKRGWTLVAFQGPHPDSPQRRTTAKRRGGFKVQQLPLF